MERKKHPFVFKGKLAARLRYKIVFFFFGPILKHNFRKYLHLTEKEKRGKKVEDL